MNSMDFFQISEAMADVSRRFIDSDRYYITNSNYQMITNKMHYYMFGTA